MRRSSNFQGFGFHIQFNKLYYIISGVEPQSPAYYGSLRVNDVIRKLNNQPTDEIFHDVFIQTVDKNSEITLHVQSLEEYLHANPHISQRASTGPSPHNDTHEDGTHHNPLSRALHKITHR
jgi:hypothetical protein